MGAPGVRFVRHVCVIVGVLVISGGILSAQTTVNLPDSSQTTTMSVSVTEQARVAVPGGITFNVTNIGASTAASAATVAIDQIVLSSVTKGLRLSLRAEAASFTAPVSGETTWDAGDVSWNAGTWTAATGVAGTLSNGTFNVVATCDAGASGCSTSALVFSLAARPTVQRAGTHSLIVTWKVESIGP